MNLLVCSLQRLRTFYGEREARRVMLAIEELVLARASRGVASRLLLVDVGIAEYGIAAASDGSAEQIASQIAAAATAMEQSGDRLESVLLIGGHAIIPFALVANPMPDDGDMAVPSDTIYGARQAGTLLAEWPVGRLPGAETANANADLLVRLIQQATNFHRHGPSNWRAKTVGMSTALWQTAAQQVYAEISNGPLLISPPTVSASLDLSLFDNAGAIYCNLHGVQGSPTWYGQSLAFQGYLIALQIADVRKIRCDAALVLSEACYGAMVQEQNEYTSLALAFLDRGAACFIGATAMAYGPATTPLGEADLLALHFWRIAAQRSTIVGTALLEARARMLQDTLDKQAALDDNDRKTALEFVLYGDPTLPLG